MTATLAEPTAKPKRLQDVPEYAEATGRLLALKAERDQLKARERELSAKAAEATAGSTIEAEVAFKLGRSPQPDAPGDMRKQLADIRHQALVVIAAIKQQETEVTRQRYAASKLVVDSRRHEYEKILKRMASALCGLEEVAVDEEKFRRELTEADVAFSGELPPMPYGGARAMTDGAGEAVDNIRRWFNQARERGYPV